MPVPAYAQMQEERRSMHRRYVASTRRIARKDRARQLFVALVFRVTDRNVSDHRRFQYLLTARRLGAISEG